MSAEGRIPKRVYCPVCHGFEKRARMKLIREEPYPVWKCWFCDTVIEDKRGQTA